MDLSRFLTNQEATRSFAPGGDIHEGVARRLHEYCPEGTVLDLGGGNGVLARRLHTRNVKTVVVDQAAYVSTAPRPALRADARYLPFADGSFDAVAALWMLYHLPRPLQVLHETARVLGPGGLFVTCAPSRHNDPEFEDVLPGWGSRSTFDAEDAADLVANVFDVVEAGRWDAQLVHLPDRTAVARFLRGRGLGTQQARDASLRYQPPMSVTKRGVLLWARARKPGRPAPRGPSGRLS